MKTKKVYKTPVLKSQKITLGVFGDYPKGDGDTTTSISSGEHLGRTIADLKLE